MEQELSPGKALAWAVAGAALLLVTVVMPAEYGVDWTGVGRVIGLTSMGEQKVAAAKAAASPAGVAPPKAAVAAPVAYAASARTPLRTDSVEVTLAPKAEIEYKAVLGEAEVIVYQWDAAGANVTFDFHGEPSAGPHGAFLSFDKGSASTGSGTLKAPFAGVHGWYWRNATAGTVVIKLSVSGFHTDLKRM